MSELRAPLYERVLGLAWHELPAEIRQMHDLRSGLTARGTAAVQRGNHWLARLVARAVGFPTSADEPSRAGAFASMSKFHHVLTGLIVRYRGVLSRPEPM